MFLHAVTICDTRLLACSMVVAVCLYMWQQLCCIQPADKHPLAVADVTSPGNADRSTSAYDVILGLGRLGVIIIYFLLCDRYVVITVYFLLCDRYVLFWSLQVYLPSTKTQPVISGARSDRTRDLCTGRASL